jgi:hypothetical protein
LLGEVAYIAYHFNWSRSDVLRLPHLERRQWVAEISTINERLNADDGAAGAVSWP